ncbi:MAG TPA: DinB family protein [Ignavibacteriales bacterium]|nr:DinB family protein [Ignavibacteriales bacterium]
MYYKISDFQKDWQFELESTLKVMKNLTDASLKQEVVPDGRTLGFLAWHITLSLGEMMKKTGLKVDCPQEDAPVPESAQEICNAYEKAAKSLLEQITSNWTDETLLAEDDMFGQKWARGNTLSALNAHQIHHRAQMTILMRQAGLKVPGVYGPSKEEWIQMGMPAAK